MATITNPETLALQPLVIIDSQVTDIDSLIQDIQGRANIFILDSQQNGISQISQALEQYPHVSSLHLVSHGSPGCLSLGNSKLDLQSLKDNQQQLTSWSQVLAGKEVLIYGCQVAQGKGEIFLNQLAELTGANLAASTQVVGLTESGSSWQLDVRVGLERVFNLIFSPSLQNSYAGAFEDLPLVSLSATPDLITEEEGNFATLNFTTTGTLPPDGLIIATSALFNPQIDFREEAFDLTDPEQVSGIESTDFIFTPEGEIIDIWTLTQPEAFIRLKAFDDSVAEPDEIYNITLLDPAEFDLEGYQLDADNTSATFTISDGVPNSDTPAIGLNIEPTSLEEGDTLTVTFTAEGDIPDGGLEINVDSDTFGTIGEFNIFDEDGNFLPTFTGLAELPEVNGDASGFTAVLTENTATITLSVFEDGPNEGAEDITFSILDGERYGLIDGSEEVTLTINDGGEDAVFTVESGVTSVFLDFPLLEQAAGITLVSADSEAEPFSEDFQVGFAITEETDFSFAPVPFTPLGGTIEHDGTITIALGDAQFTLGEFSIGFDPSRVSETASGFFVADTLDDPLGLEVLFDVGNPDDVSVSNGDFDLGDADLLLAPELATALGLNDLAGADIGDTRIDAVVTEEIDSDVPVVSFTASTDLLNEEEGTELVLNFTVDGDFPEEGVIIRFDENFFDTGDQIDFNIFELENLEFFDFEETSPGRFTVDYLLSAPTGSLTTAVFDDNVAEEPFVYNPSILPVPDANYTINPDAQSVNVTIIDGVDGIGGPVVSIDAEPTELSEGEELTITLTAEGEIPDGGIEISVASDTAAALGEFVTTDEEGIPQITTTGFEGDLSPNGEASGFFGTMVENTATITLAVFDDGPGEGSELFEFNLLDGENYDLGANTSLNITINDELNQIESTDGNDRLNGTDGNDLILGGDGADRINGNDGNDVISGGADLDRLNGGDGNDSIFGGDRTDRINGGAGDDLLSGDGGNDEIRGGAGDDLLMGVTGNDTLIGEAGSDTFVFGNGDGTDRINDFDPSEDLIGLVDGELTFADISLTQEGNNTILGVSGTGEELALLVKVSADAITDDSFVTVPDISNIDDVI
ncbi:MAG: DUF4347 domain-containing protein [Cyanobacteria bacterium P01_G01_bin.19]